VKEMKAHSLKHIASQSGVERIKEPVELILRIYPPIKEKSSRIYFDVVNYL
jgi:hypothetical protein